MELIDFRTYVLENIRSGAEISRDFFRSTFIEEMSKKLIEAEELTDFQLCQYEGSGIRNRKLQVDGYAFDEVDNSFSLIIGDFTNDDNLNNLLPSEGKSCFNLLKNFVEEVLAGKITDGTIEESNPVFGLASEISFLKEDITKFKFYLISDRLLKATTKKWEVENINGLDCELHIWDISRFHQVYMSSSGRDDLLIDFKDFQSDGLPCIKAGGSIGDYESFLCMIPGEVLGDIYNKFGSRLLEGNVRSFLSIKGKVNKGIQATINEHPEMFFAYNNGIAATAEGVVINQDDSNTMIKSLSNLQIVNGGQTTASIGAARRKGTDVSKVYVQMKLSVLPPSKAEALIPKISRFANMQNKVSDADFFSNHPYHIKLEEISRRVFTPPLQGMQHGIHWFYERARGQYLNEQAKMTPAQKNKFLLQNPKKQLLEKTDVAKVLNTFRILPTVVSLGGQKNFINFAQFITEQWDKNDEYFDDDYFKETIAKVILFKSTEEIVSDQPWFQRSYRANIVTYALAKLQELINVQGKGKQLNYKLIWENQSIQESLVAQLEIITELVFKVLLDPKRHKENVTEWAKHQQCLVKVQNIHVTLSKELLKDLVEETQVKKKKKMPAEIIIQEEVSSVLIQVVADNRKLLKFGMLYNLLDQNEVDLLRGIIQNPAKKLSEAESKNMTLTRKRLIKIGYEP